MAQWGPPAPAASVPLSRWTAGPRGPGCGGAIKTQESCTPAAARPPINPSFVTCDAWPSQVGGLLVSFLGRLLRDQRTSATSAPGGDSSAAADHRRSRDRGGRRGGGPHFLVSVIHIYMFLGCFYIYERYEVILGKENAQVPTDRKLKFLGCLGKCLRKRGGSFPESFCLSQSKEHL